MSREKWLYALLAVIFVSYVAVEHYAPEPLRWIPTYAPEDQQPYGGYILYDRLEDFFPQGKKQSFKTLYEYDSAGNILILCNQFEVSKADIDQLFQLMEKGSHVLIASANFNEQLMDTLGLADHPRFNPDQYLPGDSIEVKVAGQFISYPTTMLTNYFKVDTTGWELLSFIENGPVLISRPFGSGEITLCSFPLAFSNYALLQRSGVSLPEVALNKLLPTMVDYNRYYQEGRRESKSPFRFFVSNPPLRWSLYLTLLGVMLVLFVNSRRKQRAIAEVAPPENGTVNFVKTMGGFYYREGNHQKVAEKLISHFLKAISTKFYIHVLFTESAYHKLAQRTGVQVEEVIKTFEIIQHVKNGGSVSEQLLTDLNERISRFN